MNRSRYTGLTLAGVTLAAGLLWGADAWASPTGAFITTIPNGAVFTCLNCHTSMFPDGGTDDPQLTSFGTDVLATMNGVSVDAGGKPHWTAALCQKDSDGDGQTNGQELGDPCCTWVEGQTAPRITGVSNPSDATSKSADPSTPACNAAPPADGGDSGGGCTVVGSAVGLSGSAVALMVLALAGGPLRRRRHG
jgi:hypothetical protein